MVSDGPCPVVNHRLPGVESFSRADVDRILHAMNVRPCVKAEHLSWIALRRQGLRRTPPNWTGDRKSDRRGNRTVVRILEVVRRVIVRTGEPHPTGINEFEAIAGTDGTGCIQVVATAWPLGSSRLTLVGSSALTLTE